MMRTLLFAASVVATTVALGQNPTTIELVPWADGLPFATDVAHCSDDRLFVVQQMGMISIVTDSMTVMPMPFLDIQDSVLFDSLEQGMLGLAFDPDYANNGFFYVNYISSTGGAHSRISRFSVSGDPNMADASSEQVLYTVAQPYPNHNGGDLDFGPDGYLYIPFGDGGSAGDPQNHAQDLSDPLGDIVRIDVSDPDTNYMVPMSNPFMNNGDTLPEIWASGLRNPYRLGFDRLNGDLWLGDVGQAAWEEVDHVEAGNNTGANFGWRCYEGLAPFNTLGCEADSEYVQPMAVHLNDGQQGEWCAIIGGRVYRGAQWPHLYGHYIYTDFCKGEFWSLVDNGGTWMNQAVLLDTLMGWSAIAEDLSGELFVSNVITGTIHKIIDRCPMDPPTVTYAGGILSSSLADDYQWYQDGVMIPGATTNTHLPITNGNYYIVGGFGADCVLTSDTVQVLNMAVQGLAKPVLHLAPNPAAELVQVSWTDHALVDQVRLLDMSGRWVATEVHEGGSRLMLSTGHFAPGSYVIELCSADGVVLTAQRLMIAR